MTADTTPDRGPASPVSTYRLQLHAGFGFAAAGQIAGYLAGLGVTHVYLSPILQAAPGSAHGYDVVDHSRVSADLGGESGFRAMADQFRRHGLGAIVDIVPNHMAIPVPEYLNRQLWSVLRDGPDSPYARWFDVDWAAGDGKLLLPILAGPPGACLAELSTGAPGAGPASPEEPVLRYHDHVLPLRAGTARLPLADLLGAQHYRLADWHAAAAELNWRRFFDITSLIAIRVEDPAVFDATHALILSLLADGLIDGLRIDHPDGLADPRGYLARLTAATGGAFVVAEKILTGDEHLPADWECAGTTGYDAMTAVGGVFVDPAGVAPLTRAYHDFTGGSPDFAPVADAAKREIAAGDLAAEVTRLARLLARADPHGLAAVPPGELRAVVVDLLAAVPVYRAYVAPGEPPSPATAAVMARAAATARAHLPQRLHSVLDAVCALVLGGPRDLVVAFQQTCGPVMAKGVEDTAFYRWSRFAALTEVGSDPDHFGIPSEEFHRFAGRLARDWPATMTTLSTHDTKRQEDVRARLAVLAEVAEDWHEEVTAWHARAVALARGRPPEPDTEYLLWQTLAGAWPIGLDRFAAYLEKAMREAKTSTSWTKPDAGYESAVLGFAERVLADQQLVGRITRFVAGLASDARANSLGAKLVQLTMPGVADVYQGCELGAFALVDPDNRRPVDFARRAEMLAALDAGEAAGFDLDAGKLLVTTAALRLRRLRPGWFAAGYRPLAADGPAAAHAVAFLREAAAGDGAAVTIATRLPVGLRRHGGWRETVLPLPGASPWRDVLTGAVHATDRPLLDRLTERLPVALLVPA